MRPAKLLQYLTSAGLALIPLLGQLLGWPLVETVLLTAYMAVVAVVMAAITGRYRPRGE